jgi:hypothetical protein
MVKHLSSKHKAQVQTPVLPSPQKDEAKIVVAKKKKRLMYT